MVNFCLFCVCDCCLFCVPLGLCQISSGLQTFWLICWALVNLYFLYSPDPLGTNSSWEIFDFLSVFAYCLAFTTFIIVSVILVGMLIAGIDNYHYATNKSEKFKNLISLQCLSMFWILSSFPGAFYWIGYLLPLFFSFIYSRYASNYPFSDVACLWIFLNLIFYASNLLTYVDTVGIIVYWFIIPSAEYPLIIILYFSFAIAINRIIRDIENKSYAYQPRGKHASQVLDFVKVEILNLISLAFVLAGIHISKVILTYIHGYTPSIVRVSVPLAYALPIAEGLTYPGTYDYSFQKFKIRNFNILAVLFEFYFLDWLYIVVFN